MSNAQAVELFSPFLKASIKTDNFEIFSLAGDASARKYYRVVAGANVYVLMSWEPFANDGQYPFLNVLRHFQKHGVQVPRAIAISASEGLVLLEDLGDLTLERKFWENLNPEASFDFYREAIDELIKIHYAASADRASRCVAFDIEFNTARLLWEMNYAREHLLEKFLNITLNDRESGIIAQQFELICERLHQQPRFLAHRDYHSRNLMIKAGKIRVIDFQDARLGAVQYDLVSLLRDSYVNIPQFMVTTLIDDYLTKRKQVVSMPVSRDAFLEVFELQTIQRCLKACGSFASFRNTREDTRYLKYIHPTLKRVKSSLEHFKDYKPLLDIFENHGLFEKEFAVS